MLVTLPSLRAQTNLKDAYRNDFLIGTAVNESQYEGADLRAVSIITNQFNAITPENAFLVRK